MRSFGGSLLLPLALGSGDVYKCVKVPSIFSDATIGMDITALPEIFEPVYSTFSVLSTDIEERSRPVVIKQDTSEDCISSCVHFPGCHAFAFHSENPKFCQLSIGSGLVDNPRTPESDFWLAGTGHKLSEVEVEFFNRGLVTGNRLSSAPCGDANPNAFREFEFEFTAVLDVNTGYYQNLDGIMSTLKEGETEEDYKLDQWYLSKLVVDNKHTYTSRYGSASAEGERLTISKNWFTRQASSEIEDPSISLDDFLNAMEADFLVSIDNIKEKLRAAGLYVISVDNQRPSGGEVQNGRKISSFNLNFEEDASELIELTCSLGFDLGSSYGSSITGERGMGYGGPGSNVKICKPVPGAPGSKPVKKRYRRNAFKEAYVSLKSAGGSPAGGYKQWKKSNKKKGFQRRFQTTEFETSTTTTFASTTTSSYTTSDLGGYDDYEDYSDYSDYSSSYDGGERGYKPQNYKQPTRKPTTKRPRPTTRPQKTPSKGKENPYAPGEWGNWGACCAKYGEGKKARARSCFYHGNYATMKTSDKYCAPSKMVEEMTCWGKQVPQVQQQQSQAKPTKSSSYQKPTSQSVWLNWEQWSKCSATCGKGNQIRTRRCKHNNLYQKCVGESTDSKKCAISKDCGPSGGYGSSSGGSYSSGGSWGSSGSYSSGGSYGGGSSGGGGGSSGPVWQWSKWAPWTSCTATCDGGLTFRLRNCYSSEGEMSDTKCPGMNKQQKACNRTPCPIETTMIPTTQYVPGQWADWSQWTDCSRSCGGGNSYRKRSCSTLAMGKPCMGPGKQKRVCNRKPCIISTTTSTTTTTTPGYGRWTNWSEWSQCSTTCGRGMRERKRRCKKATRFDRDCIGRDRQSEACNQFTWCSTTSTTTTTTTAPAPFWTNWSQWSQCTQTCGYGKMTRKRTCIDSYGTGLGCHGKRMQMKGCNGFPCTTTSTSTTTMLSEWSFWSKWSTCTKTCGVGVRNRSRYCNGPACPGPKNQQQKCGWRICPTFPPETTTTEDPFANPDAAQYSRWSGWSTCTKPCGGGMSFRTRNCMSGFCMDSLKQKKACNRRPCTTTSTTTTTTTTTTEVRDTWGPWGSWGECIRTAFGGVRYRERQCVGFSNRCYGKRRQKGNCVPMTTTTSTTTTTTTIKAQWTNWTRWTTCSKSCEGGVQERTRRCSGGSSFNRCFGQNRQSKVCNRRRCDYPTTPPQTTTEDPACNTKWTEWGEWGACSKTCGYGRAIRTRKCPRDCNGLITCPGSGEQRKTCVVQQNCFRTTTSTTTTTTTTTTPKQCIGEWGDWSEWSSCSRSCEEGVMEKTRVCEEKNSYGFLSKYRKRRSIHENFPHNGHGNNNNQSGHNNNHSQGGHNNNHNQGGHNNNHNQGGHNNNHNQGGHNNNHNQGGHNNNHSQGGHNNNHNQGGHNHNNSGSHNRPTPGGNNNNGGSSSCKCKGSPVVKKKCNLGKCGQYNGGNNSRPSWGKWTNWTQCSATCGAGTVSRTRECRAYGNPVDPGKCGKADLYFESKKCETGKQCYGVGNNIFGWANWSEWNKCSKTCGGGTRTRTRKCNTYNCPGSKQEVGKCNEYKCDGYKNESGWTSWGAWGACTTTCGKGYRERRRTCTNSDSTCPGKPYIRESCKLRECSSGYGYYETDNYDNNKRECPWSDKSTPDCSNGFCSMRFAGPCFKKFFDERYMDICEWQEATKLIKKIVNFLKPLGITSEQVYGKCEQGFMRSGADEPIMSIDFEYDESTGMITYLSDGDERGGYGNKANDNMAKCSSESGLLPCSLTKTKKVTDEASLYYYMRDIIAYVKPRCNKEWNSKVEALLERFKGSVICDSYIINNINNNDNDNNNDNQNNNQNQNQNSININLVNVNNNYNQNQNYNNNHNQNQNHNQNHNQNNNHNNNNNHNYNNNQHNNNNHHNNNYGGQGNQYSQQNQQGGYYNKQKPQQSSQRPQQYGSYTQNNNQGYQQGSQSNYITSSYNSSYKPTWGVWGSWSRCPKTCGGGWIARKRKCLNAIPGKKGCTGKNEETKKCNVQKCPDNRPKWANWSNWSTCSATCDKGKQYRERQCISNNYSHNYGASCQGKKSESRSCTASQSCSTYGFSSYGSYSKPSKNQWGTWQPWGACSVTCGEGKQTRFRECYGDYCPGQRAETKTCYAGNCYGSSGFYRRNEIEEGTWSGWSFWSPCSSTCEGGKRTKQRVCRAGASCPGESEVTEECNVGVKCVATFGFAMGDTGGMQMDAFGGYQAPKPTVIEQCVADFAAESQDYCTLREMTLGIELEIESIRAALVSIGDYEHEFRASFEELSMEHRKLSTDPFSCKTVSDIYYKSQVGDECNLRTENPGVLSEYLNIFQDNLISYHYSAFINCKISEKPLELFKIFDTIRHLSFNLKQDIAYPPVPSGGFGGITGERGLGPIGFGPVNDFESGTNSIPSGLTCDRDNKFQSYAGLIKATSSLNNLHPWHTELKVTSFDGSVHFCGGVIIDDEFILTTTEHCCLGSTSSIEAMIGGGYWTEGANRANGEFSVKSIFVKPRIDTTDACLVKIPSLSKSKPATCEDCFGKACLPLRSQSPEHGQYCWMKGSEIDPTAKVGVNIYSESYCTLNGYLPTGAVDFESEFCAGEVDLDNDGIYEAAEGICTADRGSPLICDSPEGTATIFGLLSKQTDVSSCSSSGYPAVFVDVSTITDTLVQLMQTS